MRALRSLLLTFVAATVVYLAVLALHPGVRDRVPAWLSWFGEPASAQTMGIVALAILAIGVIEYRTRAAGGKGGATLSIALALTLMTGLLGLASYWDCHGPNNPAVFTPLMGTAQLLKGTIADLKVDGNACPSPMPVALEIARMSALAVIFLGVVSVAVALFHNQVDRILARFARSVTVMVGVDADSRTMVKSVADTLEPNTRLILVTGNPDEPGAAASRRDGARLVTADLTSLQAIEALPLWHKLDRLYLLDADASTNLSRLHAIGRYVSARSKHRRIPLVVRIDDPWYAVAWRAQQFGGKDFQWAADTVGRYEVTARRLLGDIVAGGGVTRVLVCGASPLTLALCADLEQRRREHEFSGGAEGTALPVVTLVAEAADEYRIDHRHRQQRLGLPSGDDYIDAVSEAPTMSVLAPLIEAETGSCAVVFVDTDPAFGVSTDPTIATRLAMRFPDVPVFAWNPKAAGVGGEPAGLERVRTYRLTMDLPSGQAHDAWARAAMLIHERYRKAVGGTSPARLPWSELDDFYRASNVRQVRNALWIVEQYGGHTWGDHEGTVFHPPQPPPEDPLEQLRVMGFDETAALAMARAEHEDWCRYYRKEGRKSANLLPWDTVKGDPERLHSALTSLAGTISQLWELGYRSAPAWRRYRRAGVVTAEQRTEAWTWTSDSGHEMQAKAGDWFVNDGDSPGWSVRDDIFRRSYEHVEGNTWRRGGFVSARPARTGESVETLEGPAVAAAGAWIVRGDRNEQWPVPGEEFRHRYEGPLEGD